MKILFLADGRSAIALNWIRAIVAQGHEVHLASLLPCQPDLALASLTVIPVAFSGAVEQTATSPSASQNTGLARQLLRKMATPAVRTWLRHRFVPLSLPNAAAQLNALVDQIQPDILHAMRIPYEGMLAAVARENLPGPPLLVSVWGNDFTLHAPATKKLAYLTQLCMQQADALHTDCFRDQKLAQEWGFEARKPAVVLPGAGGIQLDQFYPPVEAPGPVIINPRGLRAYVRTDTFFRAIPLVLARQPEARFVCPTMAGQPEPEKWVQSLGLESAVQLLPRLPRAAMADWFRKAQIVVSAAIHDGTPNTLLEAMACGCLPVAGDIETLREWIVPGQNGLLFDPGDPQSLADAICAGLADTALRRTAQKENARIIAERAEYGRVMAAAEAFYLELKRLRQTA